MFPSIIQGYDGEHKCTSLTKDDIKDRFEIVHRLTPNFKPNRTRATRIDDLVCPREVL